MSLTYMSAAHGSTLIELYSNGVKNNLSVNAERVAYLAGLEGEKQSFAQLLPQLKLLAHVRYDAKTQALDTHNLLQYKGAQKSASDAAEYELGLSQRLFDLPAYYDYKGSQYGSTQAKVKFQQALSSYTSDFLSAYLDVVEAQEKLLFIQETLDAYEKQNSIITNRYAVGLVKISELKESESQQLKVESDEILAKNDLALAFEQLSLITQVDVDAIHAVSGEIPVLHNPTESITHLQKKFKNNWGFKLASLDLTVANENWKAKKAKHLPTVTSRLSYTDSNTDSTYNFQHPDTLSRHGWNIGVYLEMPIYNGGGVSSASSEAKLSMERAKYMKKLKQLEVKQQILKNHRTLRAISHSLAANGLAVEAVELALKNSEDEYFSGLGPFSRVLDNRARLMSEKIQLIQEKYQYVKLYISLKEVMGELSNTEVGFLNRLFSGVLAQRVTVDK